ncbi:MAG TPA: glycosyltransferase family 4 protein [Terriglobales bacterium]|nr:glycosyltransferase family 4 protein [Terriglobales bacterium]
MKILTFGHLFPNSQQPFWGIFVYQRIVHFAKRPGAEVRVVSPIPYIPRWFPSASREKYKRIPRRETIGGLTAEHPRYLLVPKIAMPLHGFLLFAGCYRKIAQLYRQRNFDCIDSHWIFPDGFAAVLAGKILGVPVFCSARGTDINVYPNFRLIRPFIRWALAQSAGVIAVSQALKERIVALGIPEHKVRVIGNGVDIDRFHPIDRQEARRQLGLQPEGFVIVAVGSLTEHKGHALLISALAEISSVHTDLRLYILGEGPLQVDLESLITKSGMKNRVFLAGGKRNEELNLWYNAADLSCLPSSREGWPNVLLESLACGTPVVASRVGGVPEVITSCEYGILVEPTVAELRKGIEAAIAHKWNRQTIVNYARSRTWNEVAAEMEAFLTEQCLEYRQKS